ncbi:hypothetical protein Tco_1378120 [Tanacetum coccineum]
MHHHQSYLYTTQGTQLQFFLMMLEEDNHDIKVAHMVMFCTSGIPNIRSPSDQSSSDVIHKIVHPDHQVSEHTSKWTKDHPLENIIGALDRPVSTRLQLHEPSPSSVYYDAFPNIIEPKNYKEALTQHISQSPRGIFINQSKYALESLKKYGYESLTQTVDLHASRPDLQFAICMYARYLARPTEKPPLQMRMTAVVKIHAIVLRGSNNFWVITYKPGRLKGRKALRYPVRKLNILLCPVVVLKSFGCDHNLPTMALDSIKFQCTVITKALLCLIAATMYKHSEIKAIAIRFTSSRSTLRNVLIELYFVNTNSQSADISLKLLDEKELNFLSTSWECGVLIPP